MQTTNSISTGSQSTPATFVWQISAMRILSKIPAVLAALLLFSGVAVAQDTNRYETMANRLKELINSGDYAGIQTNFNGPMDAALPLDKSSAFFKGLTQQAGKIQSFGEPKFAAGAMVFPAKFEKNTLDMQMVLDGRGLIAGLAFKPHKASKATKTEAEKRTLQMSQADRYTKMGNQLKELINAGEYAGIQAKFNKEMGELLPLEKSSAFFKELTQQMGKIRKLGEPQTVGETMVIPVDFEMDTLDMQIALDGNDLISGLIFNPHVTVKPASEKHQTQLSLPFKGSWQVYWGGDTSELNRHHDVPNQRFALDMLGVGEEGKTQRGEGTRNEDYFAFGREVLAPADGTVIEEIEGVRDNTPGSMNPYSAVGNCVIIRHREDEISVLAHMKQGSVVVKEGDRVVRGQKVGLCGNSGNSSQPHLHYHLQNSPVLQDGLGIKCVFQNVAVTRDGKTETRPNFSPVKGEIISPE